MAVRAKITVLTGPDRGKSYSLGDELMRLGRSPENDLVLSDPQLSDHLASVVQRDGRYAIITTVVGGLEIDGTEVPAERWVWLPDEAQIRISPRTALQFQFQGESAADSVELQADQQTIAAGTASGTIANGRRTATSGKAPPRPGAVKGSRPEPEAAGSSGEVARRKRTSGERAEKKSRTVARFITDGPGDPLVKLGEDGHLPELALKEGAARQGNEPKTQSSNPMLLTLALVASVGVTMALLLVDAGGFGDNSAQKAAARVEIADYYGGENDNLKSYQIHLRRARQARSRGDLDGERAEYRKVLGQLRSEAREKLYKYTGITGRLDYSEGDDNRKSDRRLEELIAILLSE